MPTGVNSIFGNGEGLGQVILGDVVFGHMEVPQTINLGGDQMMAVQQLVGGRRVINTLGHSEGDITWSGMFWGETASPRALHLDYLRQHGEQIKFIFAFYIYDVVIKSFTFHIEKLAQLPYEITLQVVKNYSLPVPIAVPTGYNNAVQNDLQIALSLATQIDNPDLQNALNDLATSVSSAGNLGSATQDQLNSIRDNIQNCQSINNGLISGSGI